MSRWLSPKTFVLRTPWFSALCLGAVVVSGCTESDTGGPTSSAPPEPVVVRGAAFVGGLACEAQTDSRAYDAYFLSRTEDRVIHLRVPAEPLIEGWQDVPIDDVDGFVLREVASLDIGALSYCAESGADPEILAEFAAMSGTVRVWVGPERQDERRSIRVRLEQVLFQSSGSEPDRFLDFVALLDDVEW